MGPEYMYDILSYAKSITNTLSIITKQGADMGILNKVTRYFRSANDNTQVEQPYEYQQNSLALMLNGRKTSSALSLSSYFAAREVISNSIARLPIRVMVDGNEHKSHNINAIWSQTLMTKFNFMKQMVCDVIDNGNAYAYISRAQDGTPINLVYCEPGSVSHYYNQRKQEHYYRISFIKQRAIEPVDVIHLYKNSYNGVEGVSLRQYAASTIDLTDNTDKTASKYYSSGCALHGVLSVKGARKGAKQQVADSFRESHSGPNGSGILITDEDIDFKQLSTNASDSQMLEARIFNISEIARYFNINPVLLGDLSHSSYNTIEAANIEFVNRTLSPYISMIEDEFNRKLVKPSETGVRIDLDQTYLLDTNKSTLSTYIKTLVSGGIMSVNEARAMIGLPYKEGCDDLIIPYTDIAANKLGNNDIEEQQNNNDQQDGQDIP